MSQTELTTLKDTTQSAVKEPVFSDDALRTLEKEHGWLLSAMAWPIKSAIGWIINESSFPPDKAAKVINARVNFNKAATYLSTPTDLSEKYWKTASNLDEYKARA